MSAGHNETGNSSFEVLVKNIESVHEIASTYARGAVNKSLTMRNWMIGYYIVEFEQHGENRAKYGTNLLGNLAEKLKIKGLDRTMLNLCRIFYTRYPQIREVISHKLLEINDVGLKQDDLKKEGKNGNGICEMPSHKFSTPPEMLVNKLSFSHLRELMSIEDDFERFFYEIECIQGAWSVKELRRQIATNLYIRAGLSHKPELLLEKLQGNQKLPALEVKDPFTFEFLGLDEKDFLTESDIEQALIDHLQDFLLELGKGFCFEARQKRITIDDRYYWADLVLYNRLLHCSVIVELKNDEFKHEYLGQLNAYVGYFKENEMTEGDNFPIGILLCTGKGPKMVEYALSGMDNRLFVSTYMLQLPSKEQLEEFMRKQMKEMGI